MLVIVTHARSLTETCLHSRRQVEIRKNEPYFPVADTFVCFLAVTLIMRTKAFLSPSHVACCQSVRAVFLRFDARRCRLPRCQCVRAVFVCSMPVDAVSREATRLCGRGPDPGQPEKAHSRPSATAQHTRHRASCPIPTLPSHRFGPKVAQSVGCLQTSTTGLRRRGEVCLSQRECSVCRFVFEIDYNGVF